MVEFLGQKALSSLIFVDSCTRADRNICESFLQSRISLDVENSSVMMVWPSNNCWNNCQNGQHFILFRIVTTRRFLFQNLVNFSFLITRKCDELLTRDGLEDYNLRKAIRKFSNFHSEI